MVVGGVSLDSITVTFGSFSEEPRELARGVLPLLEWQMDKEPGSR